MAGKYVVVRSGIRVKEVVSPGDYDVVDEDEVEVGRVDIGPSGEFEITDGDDRYEGDAAAAEPYQGETPAETARKLWGARRRFRKAV